MQETRMQILKELAKTMIMNKGPFATHEDEVIDRIDEVRDLIEKQGWKIVSEPWTEGNIWIIPDGLERHLNTLLIAKAHGYLGNEEINDVLTKIYSGLDQGSAVIVRDFIRDFIRDFSVLTYDDKGLICVEEQCVCYSRRYCNAIYDEYGNVKASGVFRCIEYFFPETK